MVSKIKTKKKNLLFEVFNYASVIPQKERHV
jgi:hypothetical protein